MQETAQHSAAHKHIMQDYHEVGLQDVSSSVPPQNIIARNANMGDNDFKIVYRNFIFSGKWTSLINLSIFKTFEKFAGSGVLSKCCKLFTHRPVMLSYKMLSCGTVQMYESGKCAIVGCKTEEVSRELIKQIEHDLHIALHDINFSHCMANVLLKKVRAVNLAKLREHLLDMGVACRYEPELFHAIVIKTTSCTITFFHTGKLNIFGIRNIEKARIDLHFLIVLVELLV